MSTAWALGDVVPADGGPPLMSRFAAKPGLADARRGVALVTEQLDQSVRALRQGETELCVA